MMYWWRVVPSVLSNAVRKNLVPDSFSDRVNNTLWCHVMETTFAMAVLAWKYLIQMILVRAHPLAVSTYTLESHALLLLAALSSVRAVS